MGIVLGAKTYWKYSSDLSIFDHERAREQWEMENYPEGERTEMVELFVSEGVKEEDARKAIELLSKMEYKRFFVDLMMVKELKMQEPNRSTSPLKLGMATSAMVFASGLLPIGGCVACNGANQTGDILDGSSLLVAVAGALLFLLSILLHLGINIVPRRQLSWVYGMLLTVCGLAATVTSFSRHTLAPLFIAKKI